MSSDQGPKKGKGRGKNRRSKGRGRGRGSQEQQSQSESLPGGLQQHVSEESEGATALPVVQPEPQQPEPVQEPERVSETPSRPPSHKQQRKAKKKTHARAEEDHDKPLEKAAEQSSPQPSEVQDSEATKPSAQPLSQQQPKPAATQLKTQPQTKPPPKSQPPPQAQPPPPQVQPQAQPPPQAQCPQAQPPPQAQRPQAQPPPQPGQSQPPSQVQPPKKSKPLQSAFSQQPRSDRDGPRPPRRPDGGGTVGRPIKLRVNFLPVKLPVNDIHHYDTEIIAKGQKRGEGYTKNEAPKIIAGMVKQYEKANPSGPKIVFDRNGKNLYCRCPIPGIGEGTRNYEVKFITDNGKERDYTVQVQWANKVSLYELNQALEGRLTEIPRDTLQAVEVVLRHLPSMTSIPVQSSFFSFPDGHEKDLGQGLQIWNGRFVSIRPTQWKMMLNVDTCSTAFYKAQPVLHFMCEFLGLRDIPQRLDDRQRRDFTKEIKAIKVETTHIKRRQKASGLSRNSAQRETFDCEGTKTSVFDYFKSKYGITLRYPDLPCIKLGQKGNLIPLELCNVLQGQRKQGRLSPKQTQQMIRFTALPAPQRQQEIAKVIQSAGYSKDPFCHDFGIRVGQDMAQISGRVLDPPVINYGPKEKPSRQTPREGVWRIDQNPMYLPCHDLREWAIVSCENRRFLDDKAMDILIQKVVRAGHETGINIHQSPCHSETGYRADNIGKLFGQFQQHYPNLQLVIVILPGKNGDDCYEEVKHYGDIVYGIKTQCIKANTASRAVQKPHEMEAFVNIFLKINAKLGGTGSVLDKSVKSLILSRPVIIFGADVTHPAGDETTPSIAAVVASMDAHANLYSAEVRVQGHRQEMIADLKGMVITLLKKFRDKTKVKPEKIIFYRDGVSEGQFREVLMHELQAIQHACLELHSSFKPAITFIVVQKRHHTRFFAENPRDQRGKSKNIPAGTVVDKQVCHPFEFDWYLCSHAGIQGTSKPAHYHVLYDDSNFISNDLQILSNQLCYTYVRCARAVSIPAPAYYAHHVAFRARHHIKEVEQSSEGSVASGGEGACLEMDEMIKAVKIHPKMESTMYFA